MTYVARFSFYVLTYTITYFFIRYICFYK